MNAKDKAEIKRFKRKLSELEAELSRCKGCGEIACYVENCPDDIRKQRKGKP